MTKRFRPLPHQPINLMIKTLHTVDGTKSETPSVLDVNCDGQVSEIHGKSDPVSHPVKTTQTLKMKEIML